MCACNAQAHALMFTCANLHVHLHWQKQGQQEGETRVYTCTPSRSVHCQAEAGICTGVIVQLHVTVRLHAQVTLPESPCALSRRPCFAYLQKLLKLQVQMPPREGRTLNPKTACVRACSHRLVLWPLHTACTWARGLLHRHALLRHLGHFLPKKIGNEPLMWESPGFIWRSPKG